MKPELAVTRIALSVFSLTAMLLALVLRADQRSAISPSEHRDRHLARHGKASKAPRGSPAAWRGTPPAHCAQLLRGVADLEADRGPRPSHDIGLLACLTRLSPNLSRVGIRIFSFEACSSFTHIAAHRIAQPPRAAFVA